MGINNDGFSGVDIEQIALEKTIIVGTQAPNVKPAIKVDVNGKVLPEVKISENGGAQVYKTSGYDCSYADTSWLSHGGIFSVVAGNKINLTSGAGGFEWATAGPSKFNVAFQDFFCTHCFNINTRLFTVASTERTHLMGGRIDFQFDETYFTGNVHFLNNVTMGGSLFVNGELFCSHITAQEQKNFTDQSDTIKSFINPAQSFMVFNGASIAAKAEVQSLLPWKALSELGDSPAYVDCFISIMLPSPLDLINLPCKIAFPNGISLLSDATYTMEPLSKTIMLQGDKRTPGIGVNKADVTGPGHIHSFSGPAVNYVKDTASVFKEAKEMMESKTPTASKPCVPNGGTSIGAVQKQLENVFTNEVKKWLGKVWDYINPFGGDGTI